MSVRYPSREAQIRFADAADGYRKAFEAVQEVLSRTDMGRIPAWVFAIDRMSLEELHRMSPELAEVERHRRSCKVALHALAQLMALEPEPGETSVPVLEAEEDVDELINSLNPDEPKQDSSPDLDTDAQRRLDSFISVVNYARGGGCIYINGTFQPVVRTKPKASPDIAPPMVDGRTKA